MHQREGLFCFVFMELSVRKKLLLKPNLKILHHDERL